MNMRSALFIVLVLFTACQNELENELNPPTPQNLTDTSVVLIKKSVEPYFPGDTVTMIFRHNTINGVKGYKVTGLYANDPESVAYFRYDAAGYLKEIQYISHQPFTDSTTLRITRQQNRITRMQWNEVPGMDRAITYDQFNDTLLVKFNYNIGGSLYLDSLDVTLFTNSNFSRLYSMHIDGTFDRTGIFADDIGESYTDRRYHYTGNNLSSITSINESFYTNPSPPYSHQEINSVVNFTRMNGVSTFLTDLERDMFGNDFRLLSFARRDDTLSYFISDFFDYTGYAFSINGAFTEDALQDQSILGAVTAPMLTASTTFTIKQNGVVASQGNAAIYHNLQYSLYGNGRIKSIKQTDPVTNAITANYLFEYP